MGKLKKLKQSRLEKFNLSYEYNINWKEAKKRKIR